MATVALSDSDHATVVRSTQAAITITKDTTYGSQTKDSEHVRNETQTTCHQRPLDSKNSSSADLPSVDGVQCNLVLLHWRGR